MNNFLDGKFYNPTRGNLNFKEVLQEMVSYMNEKPEQFYDIIVGCDSPSDESPHFPAVVVVLRVGEGGRFFLKKINYKNRKFHHWKERILQEVLLSCELALCLRENFESKYLSQKYKYQFRYIHADIGENGATRDMIKEVIGLIRGNGFEPVIKPQSYVASTVADRYT